MEQHYDIKTQMRSKAALHMLKVDLPSDFVDTINKYVDDELIPLDKNYGKVKGNGPNKLLIFNCCRDVNCIISLG